MPLPEVLPFCPAPAAEAEAVQTAAFLALGAALAGLRPGLGWEAPTPHRAVWDGAGRWLGDSVRRAWSLRRCSPLRWSRWYGCPAIRPQRQGELPTPKNLDSLKCHSDSCREHRMVQRRHLFWEDTASNGGRQPSGRAILLQPYFDGQAASVPAALTLSPTTWALSIQAEVAGPARRGGGGGPAKGRGPCVVTCWVFSLRPPSSTPYLLSPSAPSRY